MVADGLRWPLRQSATIAVQRLSASASGGLWGDGTKIIKSRWNATALRNGSKRASCEKQKTKRTSLCTRHPWRAHINARCVVRGAVVVLECFHCTPLRRLGAGAMRRSNAEVRQLFCRVIANGSLQHSTHGCNADVEARHGRPPTTAVLALFMIIFTCRVERQIGSGGLWGRGQRNKQRLEGTCKRGSRGGVKGGGQMT